VSGNPPVFFIFPEEELPEGYELKQQITKEGDYCHYNILGVSNGRAEKWFKRRPRGPENFLICNGDGTYRQLTLEDIIEQQNRLSPP
jgi:hypothetical protein